MAAPRRSRGRSGPRAVSVATAIIANDHRVHEPASPPVGGALARSGCASWGGAGGGNIRASARRSWRWTSGGPSRSSALLPWLEIEGHLDGRLRTDGPGRGGGRRPGSRPRRDHVLEGCLARRSPGPHREAKARPLGGWRHLYFGPTGSKLAAAMEHDKQCIAGQHRRRPVPPQGTPAIADGARGQVVTRARCSMARARRLEVAPSWPSETGRWFWKALRRDDTARRAGAGGLPSRQRAG